MSKPTFYTLNEMHKNISLVQKKRVVLLKNMESINWAYVLLPCLPSLHQSKVDLKREREREREREIEEWDLVCRVKSCLKVHNQTFDPSSSIYLELPPKDPKS